MTKIEGLNVRFRNGDPRTVGGWSGNADAAKFDAALEAAGIEKTKPTKPKPYDSGGTPPPPSPPPPR